MTLLILILCIATLVLLITWFKVNPFLAFLIVSIPAGLLLGIPVKNMSQCINRGLGDTLGSLIVVIVLGAMLGKLVAVSGAAQRIARVLGTIFGYKYMVWSMTLTGFIVGIPLYYNIGFVLLIPIIFSVAYNYKLPLVYVGLPMIASLSVMHGFLPPHPSPMVLITQFKGDMATTFFYGLMIAIPAIIIAGPLFAKSLKNIKSNSLKVFSNTPVPDAELPGIVNSIFSSLLPVIIIALTAVFTKIANADGKLKNILDFVGDANIVMLLTIIIATYTLGIKMGRSLSDVMNLYVEAVKDIAMILLIIGSAGILKQVLVESGVSNEIAGILQSLQLPPLLLGWLVTAVLRLCLGSATIAGLTAVGIVYPLIEKTHVDPNLMVLSVGAGSLFCSHVNDSAFWLFKEFFGLSMKDTFKSWSVMETIVSLVGLIGVLIVNSLFF